MPGWNTDIQKISKISKRYLRKNKTQFFICLEVVCVCVFFLNYRKKLGCLNLKNELHVSDLQEDKVCKSTAEIPAYISATLSTSACQTMLLQIHMELMIAYDGPKLGGTCIFDIKAPMESEILLLVMCRSASVLSGLSSVVPNLCLYLQCKPSVLIFYDSKIWNSSLQGQSALNSF